MIKESFQFFADQLNNYFIQKNVVTADAPRVVLGNVARAYDDTTPPGPNPDLLGNRAILSLVNVEEDRVAKQQENYTRADVTVRYKNPPVFLNLYMLVSVNRVKYEQSLQWLSLIIQFFQFQNVFTPITHPSLDSRIEKLVVEMYSPSFEQVNNLWSVLGGKYLPSVIYKVRQVKIDEDFTVSESGFVREVDLDSTLKLPVS